MAPQVERICRYAKTCHPPAKILVTTAVFRQTVDNEQRSARRSGLPPTVVEAQSADGVDLSVDVPDRLHPNVRFGGQVVRGFVVMLLPCNDLASGTVREIM